MLEGRRLLQDYAPRISPVLQGAEADYNPWVEGG